MTSSAGSEMAQHQTELVTREAAALQEVVARYPPPYRLTCDLAIFPVAIGTVPAETWAGTPLISALGQTVLLLTATRYYHGAYGPERTPLQFDPAGPDLYREVACALVLGILPRFAFTFPRLWLDTPDPAPLELGWYYGFPKFPAAIEVRQGEREVWVAASDARGPILTVQGQKSAGLPSWLFTLMAIGEAIFPKTGLRATMRLECAPKSSLLRIRRWDLPRLKQWGLDGRAPFGFWLEGAQLLLGEPHKLWRDKPQGKV